VVRPLLESPSGSARNTVSQASKSPSWRMVFRMPLRVAILCLAMPGCSITRERPPSWPAIEQQSAESCPNVAGRYADIGFYAGLGTSYLSAVFNRQDWSASNDRNTPAGVVTIRQTPENVVLNWDTAIEEKREVSFSRTKGELECATGFVVLRPHGRQPCDQCAGLLLYQSFRIFLAKGVDGSLQLKKEETALGLVLLVVPAGGKQTVWHRFEAVP
jgi:hypothetical protein